VPGTEKPRAIERREPPLRSDERAMLDGWLDFHRATLLTKCEGLTDEQLRTRSVAPSGLSLLGLVRHLTEVERSWFRRALAGEDVPPVYSPSAERDADFAGLETAVVSDDLDRFRDEVERCRRVAAEHPYLDTVGRGIRGGERVCVSLRWIYLHMIEEYARHNGHADLLRERIDGATGA
jgi:uncharacterized damage-inducible protein DinB